MTLRRAHVAVVALAMTSVAFARAAPDERVSIGGDRLSVDEVVAWIGSQTGVRVRLDPGVSGVVTVQAEDVPWGDLLSAVAHATGNVVVRRDGELVVARAGAVGEPLSPSSWAPREPVTPQPDEGRRIDVEVEDEDLATVMAGIAQQVGARIAVEPDVQEAVTVSLRDIPWREAVDVIARMCRCVVSEGAQQTIVVHYPVCVCLEFSRADVRAMSRLAAGYVGRALVLGPEVEGAVTLTQSQVTSTLEAVALAGGWCAERRGDLTLISNRPGWGAPFVPGPTEPPADRSTAWRLRARGAPADELFMLLASQTTHDMVIVGPNAAALGPPLDVRSGQPLAVIEDLARALGWPIKDLAGSLLLRAVPSAPRASAPASFQLTVAGRTHAFDLQATLVDEEGWSVALIDGKSIVPGMDLSSVDDEPLPVRVVAVGDGFVRLRVEGGGELEVRLGE